MDYFSWLPILHPPRTSDVENPNSKHKYLQRNLKDISFPYLFFPWFNVIFPNETMPFPTPDRPQPIVPRAALPIAAAGSAKAELRSYLTRIFLSVRISYESLILSLESDEFIVEGS